MCNCRSCSIIREAGTRLIEAGYCFNEHGAKRLLRNVLGVTTENPYHNHLPTLKLLGGVHGATLYKILLARKSDETRE